MELDFEQVSAAALRLPSTQLARLAERLLASLDSDAERGAVVAEWELELDPREAALEATSTNARPAPEVFEAARRHLDSR